MLSITKLVSAIQSYDSSEQTQVVKVIPQGVTSSLLGIHEPLNL